MAKVPVHPKNPERVCWGCDKYCSADALRCGNGTIRTPHPVELFGEDWIEWELNARDSGSTPSNVKEELEDADVKRLAPTRNSPRRVLRKVGNRVTASIALNEDQESIQR